MLIAGYCMGIRSERRLCEEVHLNLAYRWFCRLGLDDKVPDHSTFSKNRHGRFRESNVFRHLFETIVACGMAEGLVGADGFAVDASLIAADVNKQRSVPSDEWEPEEVKDKACRAVREYLATLDDAAFGAYLGGSGHLSPRRARSLLGSSTMVETPCSAHSSMAADEDGLARAGSREDRSMFAEKLEVHTYRSSLLRHQATDVCRRGER